MPLSAGKQRILLAGLLLRANHMVSTAELIEYVWDGVPPAGARGAVQTYMARVRGSLGKACRIVNHGDGYLIEAPDASLDLHRFRDLVARAEMASGNDPTVESGLLRQALALWRGPALSNVPSETLRTLAVPTLAEERLHALERCVEVDLSLGRHRHVLAELRVVTAEHPLHEGFWGQLMRALYGSGRQAEALEAFRTLHRLLRDELGIEPSEYLQRLHHEMLLGRTPIAREPRDTLHTGPWSAACHLPLEIGSYAGNAELIDEATSRLVSRDAGTVPIVAVCGAPGTGKTAFAIRVAHRIRHAFPDGQWFVRLRRADGAPRDPFDVLAEMLLAAGLDRSRIPDDLDARAARLRAEMADRSALLLLDDAADAAQVRPLLPGTAGCAVVVTSRLDLRGLAALCDAHIAVLSGLPREYSVRLLAELTGNGREAGDDTLAEIARLCGDLPLALRLAAANIAGRSPAEVLRYVAALRSSDRLSSLRWRATQRRRYGRRSIGLMWRCPPLPGGCSVSLRWCRAATSPWRPLLRCWVRRPMRSTLCSLS
ncbi:AfsR/SARP family transcriptional regulator [Nonomuraea recticatena]|uniref:AfsR/SARP family transcriptional regulator n=1 Tax=Nonomuraea recticatena TaxID=46178 RepID=UPI0036084BA6